jgi:phosphoenolpyruvate carboxykinase (ATP)
MSEKIASFLTENKAHVKQDLPAAALVEEALNNGEGQLTDTGALMCDTGSFTGRSPKDRFIVRDELTEENVWWGNINIGFAPDKFDPLMERMLEFMANKPLYVRHAVAGADPKHQLKIRVINMNAWHNLFVNNMFIRPSEEELKSFKPDFTVIHAPEFEADPERDGTRSKNFSILNMRKRMILVGGSAYAGEIKKGVFSVLNYLLPTEHNILPMHCSANIGDDNDTAIFFGLSGTGKTTLSADPDRQLIGDDEHAWTKDTVYNFEGGCYAKVINLTRDNEPEIWDAIKFGAIVENTRFKPDTRTVDFKNTSVTENTRTAYPIHHIDNVKLPSIGTVPNNIFFLTCDAFGVLPPISKLEKSQAMFHFISGYTAKVAGTEEGITEPQMAFSACFGAPFMPLHPTAYAELLGKKMEENNVNIWLVNTGWVGGAYGKGSRIKLRYTRAMITAALQGKLNNVDYKKHPIFNVAVPQECPNVPNDILNPETLWDDKALYEEKANWLAKQFTKNFEKFKDYASDEIMAGAPHEAQMAE